MSPRHPDQDPASPSSRLSPVIVVQTTVADRDDANRLAAELLDRSLIACAQIEGPITSHYRWAGRLETATEFRLSLKSQLSAWSQLEAKLRSLHPYETPEVLMTQVGQASEDYHRWVIDQTS
ncbi:MAG: divalent-cation tolerance protein CutA [Planctomycetota bacterium]